MILTKQEVASALGVGITTLESLEKKFGPIPSTMEGKRRVITVKSLLAWERQRILSENGYSDSEIKDYQTEKARLTYHQANKTEIETRRIQNELIESKYVEIEFSKLMKEIKKSFLILPNKVSYDLSVLEKELDIKEVLNKEIKEILLELSKGSDIIQQN